MSIKRIIVYCLLAILSAAQKITCEFELGVAISDFGSSADMSKYSDSDYCHLTSKPLRGVRQHGDHPPQLHQ